MFAVSFGWLWSLCVIPALALLLKKLDAMFRFGQGRFRQAVLSLYVFAAVLAFRGDDSSAFYYVISTYLFMSGWSIMGLLVARRPVEPRAPRIVEGREDAMPPARGVRLT